MQRATEMSVWKYRLLPYVLIKYISCFFFRNSRWPAWCLLLQFFTTLWVRLSEDRGINQSHLLQWVSVVENRAEPGFLHLTPARGCESFLSDQENFVTSQVTKSINERINPYSQNSQNMPQNSKDSSSGITNMCKNTLPEREYDN